MRVTVECSMVEATERRDQCSFFIAAFKAMDDLSGCIVEVKIADFAPTVRCKQDHRSESSGPHDETVFTGTAFPKRHLTHSRSPASCFAFFRNYIATA